MTTQVSGISLADQPQVGSVGFPGPKGDVGDVNPQMPVLLAAAEAAASAASGSATAAQSAQTAAQTAQGAAESARDLASSYNTAAQGHASAASASEIAASAAKTAAEAARDTAQGHATTATSQAGIATTKAGEAAGSAAAAAASVASTVRKAEARSIAAGMANGLPTAMSETGQAMTSFGNAPLTVTGGEVSHTWNGVSTSSAGYMQTVLPGTARRAGAVVRADPGSVSTFDLIFPGAAWTISSLSAAGVHYVVRADGNWHVSYWNGTSESNYAEGTIAAWADGIQRTVEIEIDIANSAMVIQHPDGSLSYIRDSRIAANLSQYVVWELYWTPGSAEAVPIKILEWWADHRADRSDAGASLFDLYKAQAALLPRNELPQMVATVYNPSTQLSVATTSSLAAPDSTNIRITAKYGPTGCVRLELDAYYEFTSADQILGRLLSGGGAAVATSTDCIANGDAGQKARIHHQWVVTGGTPGASGTWIFYHSNRSVVGAATLKAGGTGASIRPPICLTATPY